MQEPTFISLDTTQQIESFLSRYKQDYRSRTQHSYTSAKDWTYAIYRELWFNPSNGRTYLKTSNSDGKNFDQIINLEELSERTPLLTKKQNQGTNEHLIPNRELARALVHYDKYGNLSSLSKRKSGLPILTTSGETIDANRLQRYLAIQLLQRFMKNFVFLQDIIKSSDTYSPTSHEAFNESKVYVNRPFILFSCAIEDNSEFTDQLYAQSKQHNVDYQTFIKKHLGEVLCNASLLFIFNKICVLIEISLTQRLLGLVLAFLCASLISKKGESNPLSLRALLFTGFLIQSMASNIDSFLKPEINKEISAYVFFLSSCMQASSLLNVYSATNNMIGDFQRIFFKYKEIQTVQSILSHESEDTVIEEGIISKCRA